MAGIGMAGIVREIVHDQINSSLPKSEENISKNVLFSKCGNPPENENYHSFMSRYWTCVRNSMKKTLMTPVSDKALSQTFLPVVPHQKKSDEKKSEWTVEDQIFFCN
tara:strand:+ start:907 stop:1227 length:321 start_codon:yes stop_codon:yes gene_type:complete